MYLTRHELEYLLTDVNSGYVVDPNLEEEEFNNSVDMWENIIRKLKQEYRKR